MQRTRSDYGPPDSGLPIIDLRSHCLFLDFDGTLVEIALRPEAVSVAPETLSALTALHRWLGGALAIVSGRPIPEIDRFLTPLVLPAAGVHGLTRRAADGRIEQAVVDQSLVALMACELGMVIDRHPGVLLETKWGAVALHYRSRPELAELCVTAVKKATAACTARIELLPGKMVIEAKFAGADKGSAIHAFMDEPPFKGRRPVFVGDDATDEDGFAAVHALNGLTAKVGTAASIARHRFESTQQFLAWLDTISNQMPEWRTSCAI